jgi:D-amino-acid dehydrogenase
MRVAVIGAGIVGVTTAYELAALGHEVTVFERRAVVASEGSFANAGVLAPGYVTPWAAPGMPWKVLSHLLSPHSPVRFGGPAGLGALANLPWLWRWWRACRPREFAANRAAMFRLAVFSRQRLAELTTNLDLAYEQQPGFVVLLRRERDLKAARPALRMLDELGVAHELVDAARCHAIEPGLNAQTPLHAAIHLPQDGVGNCRHFAHLLKAQAQRLGARFRFETEVLQLTPGTPQQLLLRDEAPFACDATVVCAGAQANALLHAIGCALPLVAVHGHSITAPLRFRDDQAHAGPRGAVMDERFKVAVSRLGQRIRVAGGAELGGATDRPDPAALRTLYRVLDDWFPGATLAREAQAWRGARPMLPAGPPLLGASGAPGVWLNLGHGSSGWALACGSARVLAECISGRAAPIDLTRLSRKAVV